MAEDFDIGVKKLPIVFAQVVDGKFEPITGLNNSTIRFVRADTGAAVSYDNWEEIGAGLYQFWNFQIPGITFTSGGADYQGHLNLKVQYWNGSNWVTKAETFSVYRNQNQFDGQDDYPPSRAYVDNRVDRQGDTIFNLIQYDSGVNLTTIEGLINSRSLIHKNYADNRYVVNTGSGFVTLDTAQTITGRKTIQNAIIDVSNYDINNARFVIQQASNPPNGGVIGLAAGYRNNNKMLFDFYDSQVNCEDLKIKTSAAKYITGNPSQNDYVWKKWVTDNFQPISSTYTTNTIIIDQKVVSNVLLKLYSTIQAALEDLEGVPANNNRYTLLLKYPALTNKYTGNIELPDWVNIIGESPIIIDGSLSRSPSSETGITSVLHNLEFIQDAQQRNYDIDRINVNNCVFKGNLINFEKSKLRNCGLYSGNVQSSGNNKIINCFGNYEIAWMTTDKVYSYHLYEGDDW